MTNNEFAPIAALIDNCCKDDFDEAREAAYGTVLAHLPAVDVRQAVVNLLGRPGNAWVPSTMEIAAEVHAVQYVGTLPWARERFRAIAGTLTDEQDVRRCSARAFDLEPLMVEEIAEHVLAVHDTYGKAMYAATAGRTVRESEQDPWLAMTEIGRAYVEACFALAAPPARQVGEGTRR